MTIADKAVLVTGANRGIGRALVEEALKRGAKRLYAGTRQPFARLDGRVTRLALDVTSAEQIQRAVDEVGTLDVLINNAGIAMYDDLSKPEVIEQHNNFCIRARGSIADVENAFQVQLNDYQLGDRTFRANAGDPYVEGPAAAIVQVISGLDNAGFQYPF